MTRSLLWVVPFAHSLTLLGQTPAAPAPAFRSQVHIFDTRTRQSTLVHEGPGIIEAPNWSRDGKHLLVNTGGRLYRISLAAFLPAKLDPVGLDPAYRCNNDHDYSPDGRWIAFSASTPDERRSRVFVAGADGSEPRLVTAQAPSYFHGWSPDGQWVAFVGQREGKLELYRVRATGGPEERLTSAGGFDDGPDYSPDGRWIYFNSNRPDADGKKGWNIWRIPVTGGGDRDTLAQQVTADPGEDWFPHVSPNGRKIVLLSFPPGTEGHSGRMPGFQIRWMDAPGASPLRPSTPEALLTIFGGQGTMNVNSWSPDSTRFAYVSFVPER